MTPSRYRIKSRPKTDIATPLHDRSSIQTVAQSITGANEAGCLTALALILLRMCPDIKRLSINLRPPQAPDSLPCHLESCACCPDMMVCLHRLFSLDALGSAYGRLTGLWVTGHSSMRFAVGDSHKWLSSFLALPALQTLNCRGFGSVPSSFQWMGVGGVSNVTTLRFEAGFLTYDDLIEVRNSFKALRKLHIHRDVQGSTELEPDGWTPSGPLPWIDQHAFIDALAKHSVTLEKLVLENMIDAAQVWIDTAADFTPFITLRELEVDDHVLVGWGTFGQVSLRLPPALSGLSIHFASEELGELTDVLKVLGDWHCETLEGLFILFPCYEDLNDQWDAWNSEVGRTRKDLYESGDRTDDIFRFGVSWSENGEHIYFWLHGRPASHICRHLVGMIREQGFENVFRLRQVSEVDGAEGTDDVLQSSNSKGANS